MKSRRLSHNRPGFMLIIVLVVLLILALGAYAFSELMLSHREAAIISGRQIQARVATDSGVEAVRLTLAQDKLSQVEGGGLFDNPDIFRGVLLIDDLDPKNRVRFTLVSPNLDSDGNLGGFRYGLENESARLNLNALLMLEQQQEGVGRTLLMALPGCTDEIADSILDFLDADDEPREYGAEVDYYSGLTPPYAPKNGPLDTVEELLLVRGVTPELLFGLDVNRNGIVDEFERGGGAATAITPGNSNPAGTTINLGESQTVVTGAPAATGDLSAEMSRGWSAYLTLFSMERNANRQGRPRVFLNQDNMQTLYDQLRQVVPEDWATFIVAYRQNGAYTGTDKGVQGATGQLDLTRPGRTKLVQVLDLIGKRTRVTFSGDSSPTVLETPFPEDFLVSGFYLPILMDNCTVSNSPFIPGRININQAPKTILAGIPGMSEEILTEILSRREFEPPEEMPNRRFETWLMAEGIVTTTEMRLLMPFITGGGDVHRAQVVGYYEGGGASSRAEVVWDATAANPRVLFWRDLSHLGRGFALETLGVELQEAF